ncbi:MAG: hypothetical protein M3Z84_09585, partial [Actinomycetota bacterium]|nr:hypothetical protein [Actinomycetota bacterium]
GSPSTAWASTYVYAAPSLTNTTGYGDCGIVNVTGYAFQPYGNVRLELLPLDLSRVVFTSGFFTVESDGNLNLTLHSVGFTGPAFVIADEAIPWPVTVGLRVTVC